jgi:hypothetical protein
VTRSDARLSHRAGKPKFVRFYCCDPRSVDVRLVSVTRDQANVLLGFPQEDHPMPAKSEKQRKMMGADLARARAGKPTKTGMKASQLRDFVKKPTKSKK